MLSFVNGNKFLAGSAIYLLSNILNAAIPFTLLPILTRYLTPDEYGEVAIFQTLLGALAAFVSLSMHGAAGRKFYDSNISDKDLSEFIGSCLQILLVTSGLTFIATFLLSERLEKWLSIDSKWILYAVFVTSCSVVIQLRLGQWQVRKRAKKYGVLQVSHSLLNLALSLVLVIIFTQGAEGRITAQIIAVSCFAILSLWLLKKSSLIHFFLWSPGYIREILEFGVPLIPHVAGAFLLVSVDRFVINSELGLSQTGIYMVAVQFSAALALVFDAVNKAYIPWLYERLKRNKKEEKVMIVRYTYLWYFIILVFSILAFLIGPWLITFVAGEQYSLAGSVIGWLVLGQVFGGMYLMVTNYIFYSKKTGLLSIVTLFSGFLNIAFLLVLIDGFGMEGAAYAFCLAMAVRFFLTWWVAQKRHPMPWFNFI